MDLDYKSVKALASPTRLEILRKVLNEEATTTKLSEDLEKSKSTVSSHLKVLTESGLLEKDEEEGRRRVVYKATGKAKAIAENRERKVKFSVMSSALTAFGAVYFISNGLTSTLGYTSGTRSQLEEESAGAMGAMDAGPGTMTAETGETVNQTAQNTAEGIQILQKVPEINIETVLGIILVLTTLTALIYAFIHFQLKEEKIQEEGEE